VNGHRPAVLANLYPWDADGDPAAADRIAGLGLTGVTLAAAYHAVRAATPFHPRHRVVTRDAAVYYRQDPARWRGARLRALPARDAGSFERAAEALRSAGLTVTAWAVLTHNARLGAAVPSVTVRNAFGDRYPWALCIAEPAVLDYAAALAAEVAALPDAGAAELEACGWYGVEHGSAHDKTESVTSPEAKWLLSVCFCPACRREFGAAGADPARLAAQVRAALTPAGGGPGARPLPPDAAGLLAEVRARLAGSFQREVIAAARAAAAGKRIYLHAHPDPRATGANPGCDPAALLGPGGADGIVLSCWHPQTAAGLVTRTVRAAKGAVPAPAEAGAVPAEVGAVPAGAVSAPAAPGVAASLLAVAGLGGSPATLPEQAQDVLAAGATELRLYHAGLAPAADLAVIRALSGYPLAVRKPGAR
jgi:hypothetical protein